jgi:signal transduction histidine kinase/ligand-binding sensor domain-containing protein/DNA-binding response OmpR family regulator
MKKYILLLLTFLFELSTIAQTFATFTPYSTEMGFVQKEVMMLAQDEKGQMWFATWDGLYRFDGYRFSNYKARPGNGVKMETNRLERICIDGDHIWMLGYNGDVSCFSTVNFDIQSLPLEKYIAKSLCRSVDGGIIITTKDNRIILARADDNTHKINVHILKDLPNSQINKIELDSTGRLWIFTGDGLYSCDTKGLKLKSEWTNQSFYDMSESNGCITFCASFGTIIELKNGRYTIKKLPTSADIICVIRLHDGRIVAATNGDGLFVVTADGKIEQHYTRNNSELNSDHLSHLKVDTHENVWFCTGQPGVMRWGSSTNRLCHLEMEGEFNGATQWNNDVNIVEDSQGHLWISPSGNGLAYYDAQNNRLIPYFDKDLQQEWTAENTIVDLFIDKQDNLWYCGKYTGLEKVTLSARQFYTLDMKRERNSEKDIRGLFQDKEGNVWIGAKDGVISVYDSCLNYLGNLTFTGEIKPLKKDHIGRAYCFAQDKEGTLWIGTKFNGLIELKPKGNLKYQLTKYRAGSGRYDLVHDDIFSLCLDHHNRLWIATYGGGVCYLSIYDTERKFISSRNLIVHYPKEFYNKVRCITVNSDGLLWIGTTSGLLAFRENFKHPEEIKFQYYTRDPEDETSLSNNDILQIFFTSRKEMYVCTYGGGFCHVTPSKEGLHFKSYTTENGLRSDVIFSVQEDNNGNLWFSTENGLVKYDPKTDKSSNFSSRFFGSYIDINEGTAIRLNDGRLMFPSRNQGAMYFAPQQVRLSNYVPPIILTRLYVGQEEEMPGSGVLDSAIDKVKKITLPHNKNSFSIEFSALDYRDPKNLNYSYTLEGQDKHWNSIGNNHLAIYNNLLPGRYRLFIKSTNSDGVWVENTRSIDIEIKPSFWQTKWAIFLTILFLVIVIIVASYILFTIFRLKQKVQVEQHLSELKLRFFTDISHEIRTPLTLISGSIKEILRHGVEDKDMKDSLIVVDKNSNRLLRLVAQILDFRKMENGNTHLSMKIIDLGECVEATAENFQNIAREQRITFCIEQPESPVLLWADADALDKIIFNLLSNAFRFTPSGKGIFVRVMSDGESGIITITDEGAGIAKTRMEKIFNLFESEPELGAMQQQGTGIGLALTKKLVELHQGTISVESILGEGSTFTVRLPRLAHSSQIENHTIQDNEHSESPSMFNLVEAVNATATPTILIVEDSNEMRDFIKKILQQSYQVIEAENGQEGFERAKVEMPNLILTDYMMPIMDGMEMIKLLKKEISTSHIPVIILSARTDCSSKIYGLEYGADDYMEKPFNADILRARIKNILLRLEYTRSYFRNLYLSEQPTDIKVKEETPNPLLSDFMIRLNDFLQRNISNGELDVEEVASYLNMSRSVYFKKLKAITGLSPNEYLKQLRMKRAADLIDSQQYTITEISMMVGINDPHYFSKCFRQHFNCTPTEWKNRKEDS